MSNQIGTNESSALFKVPTLTGLDDFYLWKSAITDSFLMLGSLDIVEGTESMPVSTKTEDSDVPVEEKPIVKTWMDRNRKSMALMRRTISDALKMDIEDCRSAHEIWARLCEIHDLDTDDYRSEIKREIANFFYIEGGDLKGHLDDYLRLLLKASSAGMTFADQDKALMFLESLPDSFAMLKLQWRMMDPSKKTFNELRREYNLLGAQRARTQARSTAAVLFTKQKGGQQESRTSASKATHGEKKSGGNSSTKIKGVSKIKCFKCQQIGHMKRDCPKKDKKGDEGSGHENGQANLSSAPGPFIGIVELPQFAVDPTIEPASHLVSVGQHTVVWIIDSGATHHIVGSEALLQNKKELEEPLRFGLATRTGSMSSSTVGAVAMVSEDGKAIVLEDVHHVRDARVNLLSANVLIRKGWKVVLERGTSRLEKGSLVVPLTEVGGLFHVRLEHKGRVGEINAAHALAIAPKVAQNSLYDWHVRLGHMSLTGIKNLARNKVIEGLDIAGESVSFFCDACQQSKSHLLPFGDSSLRGDGDDILFSDVAGPLRVSASGHRYYVTLGTTQSGIILAQAIPAKSSVVQQLIKWILGLEKALKCQVRILRTDRGGEYVNKELESWLDKKGILHQTTPAYTPQLNGIAERKNRTIKEMMSAMLIGGGVTMAYWDWALTYATIIMLSTTVRDGKTVWERLFSRKVDVSLLQPFGCAVWYHVPVETRLKDDLSASNPKSWRGKYLGLTFGSAGGAVLNEQTGKVHVSRNLVFEPAIQSPQQTRLLTAPVPTPAPADRPASQSSPAATGRDLGEVGGDEVEVARFEELLEDEEEQGESVVNQEDRQQEEQQPHHHEELPPPIVREQQEPAAQPRWARPEVPARTLPDRAAAGRNRAHGEVSVANGGADSDEQDPLTYEQALRSPNAAKWVAAMQVELANHQRAGTWEDCNLPEDRRAVSCKWVYKTKRDGDGNIVKYKARVVARGFSQQPGVDFQETHAPTARLASLRAIVALAIKASMHLHQMDVEAAYLNAEMDVELYMQPPKGYTLEDGRNSLRMRRALYGYKQAGRLWWKKFGDMVKGMGFKSIASDPCIYIRTGDNGKHTYLLLYVDDILIADASMDVIDEIKAALKARWRMSDLGEAKWILGISIVRTEQGAHLSQSAYIDSLVHRFPVGHSRPVLTPMDPSYRPMDPSSPPANREVFQSLVGSLMWAGVGTRGDIAFHVGVLGRCNAQPTEADMEAALRVVGYLRTTRELGIWVSKGMGSTVLEGWTDSDWAGDAVDRKSTTGYVFKLYGTPISWASVKQPTTALSTVHAEYVALCEATRDAAWLLQLLDGLKVQQARPVPIHSDSTGALTLAQHPAFHRRSKHIDVQYHYVREAQEKGWISVSKVSGSDNTANILTKALARTLHQRHVEGLGLLYSPRPHTPAIHPPIIDSPNPMSSGGRGQGRAERGRGGARGGRGGARGGRGGRGGSMGSA